MKLAKKILKWLILLPSDEFREEPEVLNYKVWNNSQTVFLFGGRFKTLNRFPILIITLICLFLPLILFLVFEAKWIWFNVHPSCVIIFLYCWLISFFSYLKASNQDSGILPKNIHKLKELPTEYLNSITLPGGNNEVLIKFCSSCNDWRPPRSFHCSICNNCILIHDHHCKWLGNCIGFRNYKYFFNFLLFGSISCIYLSVMSYYKVFKNGFNYPVSLFIAILSNLIMLYPLLLLLFHIYLLFTQQTTREFLRDSKNNLNPFSDNDIWNFIKNLSHSRGYSSVRRREVYRKGDQRFEDGM